MIRIVFDFELTETPIADTPKIRIVLNEIRELIYQRLKILQNEMAKYDGAILVNVLGTMPDYPLGIGNAGYPKELQKKISESLSEQDMEYAYNKMITAFEEL